MTPYQSNKNRVATDGPLRFLVLTNKSFALYGHFFACRFDIRLEYFLRSIQVFQNVADLFLECRVHIVRPNAAESNSIYREPIWLCTCTKAILTVSEAERAKS